MSPEVLHDGHSPVKLSRGIERILSRRTLPGNPENALLSVLTGMANAGWTWTDASHRLFSGPPRLRPAIALSIGEKGVHKLWIKAEAKVRENPPINGHRRAKQVLGEIRAFLDGEAPWTGRAGRRDRVVLEAVHAYATLRGLVILPLATRTVSDLTGGSLSFDVVADALRSLVARGWLKLVTPFRGALAAVYKLLAPAPDSGVHSPTHPEGVTPGGARVGEGTPRLHELLQQDVFLSLGQSAAAIWRVLDTTRPTLQKDIPALTGLSLTTVRRHLARLVKEKLVFRDSDGFMRVEVDLPALAVAMGVDGKAEANRRKHAEQRAMWKVVYALRRDIAREKHRTKAAARQAASEPLRARKATPSKHTPAPRVTPKPKRGRRGGVKHRQQNQLPAARRRIGKDKESAR